MLLPRGDQYNEAVQNPQLSFSDIELKSTRVETDFLGLPKPYSGGFTVTFKLQNTQKSWAVRCMIRDTSDLQRRYQAITDFFATKSSRFFIDAKYLGNGIKVNGLFYPIIKMKWMEGDPINIYLSNNYNNKAKVEALLNDFQNLINELEVLNIAHGDLQQGNIIVKNERLYLIDYDGMYLPALNGLQSNELGHPNFQHPQRNAKHFNAKIDRFSSILIYLSLKGVIYRPTLWNKYHNSDNLIIKSQDIGDLSNSKVIADLSTIPEIKNLVERFVGICHLDFEKVPSLKEFISGSFAYDKSQIGKITVKNSLYEVLDGKMKGTILEHYGERVEVVGFIAGYHQGVTFNGDPYYFLNIGRYPNQTFTVTIWSEGINSLAGAGIKPTSLVGKWISVIGVITSFRGNAQTVAELASQIQVFKDESEANDRLNLKRTVVIESTVPKSNSSDSGNRNVTEDKEARVFNDLYQKIPVPKPAPKPIPPSTPLPITLTSKPMTGYNNQTYNPIPSANQKNSNNNNGCIVPIIFAIIGACIVGVASEGKLWFLGAIGGGFIGGGIYKAFK